MKVLWFEISVPHRYANTGLPTGGWQDSLENIVKDCGDIKLSVAFQGNKGMLPKTVDGIDYYPLIPQASYLTKKLKWRYNRWAEANAIIPLAVNCIKEVNPDVIHIFGTEWEFGQVAKYTDIPCVIHMQGCLAPYINAKYPPGYSSSDSKIQAGLNLKKRFHIWQKEHYSKTELNMEKSNFMAVANYMGRTRWDRNLVELFNPNARYYYCSEVLRPSFTNERRKWTYKKSNTLKLISIGCGNHWKGMDTVLRTAHLLKECNIDFEWKIAGKMFLKDEIEKKEKILFAENKVSILGFVDVEQLKEILLDSDMLIHTAYIDNSPNAICEAQYLGVPIISTYVGGIPSLIENDKEGLLIPSNEPHTLAFEIISLAKDKERMIRYSENTRRRALERHNPKSILRDLRNCYYEIQK